MAQRISQQLLVQVRRLALLDPCRPQQGNLRRAVSAAYYGLFHFLIAEPTRFLLGTTATRDGLGNVLAREFIHAEMASTARTFAGGALPAALSHRLGALAIPAALWALAQTFLEA